MKILTKKIPNLKLVVTSEYKIQKDFLLKDILKILSLPKLKTQFLGFVIRNLNGELIAGTFHEKQLQKTNQQEFRIEKIIKRKGDKLYVKWKGYNNSFNSWIDKKELV